MNFTFALLLTTLLYVKLLFLQTDIINKYGYSVEVHKLVTKDNYILSTYRIPRGKNSSKINQNPILLAHGMLGSSGAFLLLGENSIPFLLADRGYDVWLMNARGTVHSRKHKYLSEGQKYWDFR